MGPPFELTAAAEECVELRAEVLVAVESALGDELELPSDAVQVPDEQPVAQPKPSPTDDEASTVHAALETHRWNVSRAADGISRYAFIRLMKKHGLRD